MTEQGYPAANISCDFFIKNLDSLIVVLGNRFEHRRVDHVLGKSTEAKSSRVWNNHFKVVTQYRVNC